MDLDEAHSLLESVQPASRYLLNKRQTNITMLTARKSPFQSAQRQSSEKPAIPNAGFYREISTVYAAAEWELVCQLHSDWILADYRQRRTINVRLSQVMLCGSLGPSAVESWIICAKKAILLVFFQIKI